MITEKIYKQIRPKLAAYAYSLTKNVDDAHDLIDEVITKILESDNIPNDVNIEAYATRSVKNLFLTRIKKASREVSEQRPDGTSIYDIEEDPTSGSFVEEGDLKRVLMGLEIKCREILILHSVGNSYKEISEVLEIALGTVMSRMARCREHLDPVVSEGKI